MYIVYGDGCDYMVIDGLWEVENDARARAQFLNTLKDEHCDSWLCLDWDVEELTLKYNINEVPGKSKGWFL